MEAMCNNRSMESQHETNEQPIRSPYIMIGWALRSGSTVLTLLAAFEVLRLRVEALMKLHTFNDHQTEAVFLGYLRVCVCVSVRVCVCVCV